ncbi:hypothetical protein [Agromyces soli]|uniref:Nuclear transport factor 2 family protein n=1 Tax=Agromyces soli TaxID=659012 RepID=A0ABY4AY48_9MICO|nr:hypothetical protein [Agromyces soli]UOE27764.1 hypothetical protein MTP13_08305 [Agromyces soli]
MPRTRRSLAAAALALGLAAVLAGCDAGPVDPPSSPPPSAAPPIFASDEEALAAAEEAYAAYLGALDLVGADGGHDRTPFDGVVGDEFRKDLDRSFDELQEAGVRSNGTTRYDRMTMVEMAHGEKDASLTTYVCVDVSDVRVLNEEGTDVTPERPNVTPFQVQFESDPSAETGVIVSRSVAWRGANFCS